MTQSAIVTRIISSDKAEVAVERVTACGSNCASCGGCSYKKQITAIAINRVSAKVGDRVTVSTRSSRIISAAALVYIFPLLMFFTGYALSGALNMSEKASVAISLGALFLGVLIVVLYQRFFGSKKSISFEIISID
ncbi:MAG: SoxR reducing system RseC family protein [Oscillospiraceae bacterium]